MALVAKVGTPSLATVVPGNEHQPGKGLLAGEAIAAGDLCYIRATDGRVWRSNGTAAGAAAKVRGIAAKAADVGKAVSIYRGVTFYYGTGLAPGADLYASATAGAIDDAATAGGTGSIGFVEDATRIFITGSTY